MERNRARLGDRGRMGSLADFPPELTRLRRDGSGTATPRDASPHAPRASIPATVAAFSPPLHAAAATPPLPHHAHHHARDRAFRTNRRLLRANTLYDVLPGSPPPTSISLFHRRIGPPRSFPRTLHVPNEARRARVGYL